jgi:hypothetical protein
VETDVAALPAGAELHAKARQAIRAAGYPIRVPSDDLPIFYVTRRP